MDTITRAGLIDKTGRERFFSRIQYAREYAWDGLGDGYDWDTCPPCAGRTPCFAAPRNRPSFPGCGDLAAHSAVVAKE